MASTSFLSLLILLFSGGSSDLLDFVQTDAFWKTKSVTVSVEQLLADLKPDQQAALNPAAPKAGEVRRLMAIRTLGEMKKAEAVPALQGLLQSKEPFVADYAQSALDSIAGKPVKRTGASAAVRKADLALLPAKLDLVAQLAPPAGEVMTLESIVANTPMENPGETQQIFEQAAKEIVRIAEMIGNARIDSVTVGLYTSSPGKPGYAVFVAHGLYDSHAAAAAVKLAAGNEVEEKNLDGVAVLQNPHGPPAIIFASDERAVVIVGDTAEAMPVAETAAAVKKGAGDFANNADLVKLVKSIDTSSMLWAVTKVTDGLRDQAPDLAAFDTATLTGSRKVDVFSFSFNGVGPDVAKVQVIVDLARKGIADAAAQFKQQQQPGVKPVVDFLESVKIEENGGKASARGMYKGKAFLPVMHATGSVLPEPSVTVDPPPPVPPKGN